MQLFKNRVAKNAGWIIIGQIARSIIAMIISMLTARYLGPSNFGLISYAASIVAFATPLMTLGFPNVLVQEFTNHPEDEGKIVGTSVFLSLISAVACTIGVISYTLIADAGEFTTNIVTALYSLILIFQALDLIQYWFQAKLLSKYTAMISMVSYGGMAIYKIVLLMTGAEVYYFALSNSLDCCLMGIILFFTYRKLGGAKITFSGAVGKRMFACSKHYIVSNMMITIFAQTDKIMLKAITGETAVGYYSAAVTCAGITGFIFSAIIDSFRPGIFQYKKANDQVNFEKSIQRLYGIVIYAALAQSVMMTLMSTYIILVLYGNHYMPAVPVLQIVVWYTTFSYIGSIRNIWILGENKQKYLWILNLCGALMNVVLNILLIPKYGVLGAAVASLVTQIFANVIMNVIVRPLRHNNYLIVKGLNPKLILELMKE